MMRVVLRRKGAAIVTVVAVNQDKRIKIIKLFYKVVTSKVIHYLRRVRVLKCLRSVGMK